MRAACTMPVGLGRDRRSDPGGAGYSTHLPMQETQETRVRSLGQDDRSPGGGNATHSSILAWRLSWTEKPSRTNSPRGLKESDMTEQLSI